MTWTLATVLLVIAAPAVLWPLVRPGARWISSLAGERPAAQLDSDERRERELEEIELDVAAGRLSEEEAARRRRELR